MEDGTLLLMYRSLYSLQIETCVTVHLWQMTTLFQEPSPDSLKTFNFLPRTWRLESRNTYRGADAMHWRLVNHSQASVCYLKIKAAAGS
jgi:T-cell leukemia/lymphoma 1B